MNIEEQIIEIVKRNSHKLRAEQIVTDQQIERDGMPKYVMKLFDKLWKRISHNKLVKTDNQKIKSNEYKLIATMSVSDTEKIIEQIKIVLSDSKQLKKVK